MKDFVRQNKKASFVIFILFLLMTLLLVLSIYRVSVIKPSEYIVGFYQSTEYLPDLYEFSFDGNEFYLKYNDQFTISGTYERHEDNIFICRGENDTILITLLNNGFFYYDNNNERVVKLIKITNIPSRK